MQVSAFADEFRARNPGAEWPGRLSRQCSLFLGVIYGQLASEFGKLRRPRASGSGH